MFNELQRLFRESMAAFRAELDKREPVDQVAELLAAMRREMVAARASLPGLLEEVEGVRAELGRERELLARTERRGAMAERIGDAETARVAAEFAERHREHIVVLQQKVEAAQAEHALRSREVEEMKRRYQEADANRFALVARLRRDRLGRQMRSRLDGSAGPFADFARMEEAVNGSAAYADALEELEDPGPAPRPASAVELEERLKELKRRMGKE